MNARVANIVAELRHRAVVSFGNNMATSHLAAVMRGNKILAYGGNHDRSYVNGCCTSSVHAEQDALLNALRLSGKSGQNYSTMRLSAKKEWCFLQPKVCQETW